MSTRISSAEPIGMRGRLYLLAAIGIGPDRLLAVKLGRKHRDGENMGAAYASAGTYASTETTGTGDEWIGKSFTVEAPHPVEASRIADFCAMVEDANPLYWDPAFATSRHGGPVAPPAMLTAWRWPDPWNPYGRPQHGPSIAMEVPLPSNNLIHVQFSCTFERPMLVGDRLSYRDRLTGISAEKRTSLGMGRFITADTTVTNQKAQVVATYRSVMLRYSRLADPKRPPIAAIAPRPLTPDLRDQDGNVPRVVIPVTHTLCAQITAATRDFFPGHHDGDFARSQGIPDAYPSTGFYSGLVDRVAMDWAGHDADNLGRVLRMYKPAPVGTVLETRGLVETRTENGSETVVDLRVEVIAAEALVARALVTLLMPARR